ncbi:hypothetical protein CLI85_11355 [Tannerella forsythia]|nr:hypothetical protein CLI85_11355 [Tannerella forsythia]
MGQAKSDKKEILRFALNDKLMVNCYAGYTVSECRGTSPLPPPSKGGRAQRKGGMLSLQRGNAEQTADY